MLKSILNLKGAQQLSKKDQKSIKGGGPQCQLQSDGSYVCFKRCGTRFIPTTAPCPIVIEI